MGIRVRCPNPACGKTLDLPTNQTGDIVKCPACQKPFQVVPGKASMPKPPTPQPSIGASKPPKAAPSDPLVGQRIAHYQIESLLGEGGMGKVYKARNTRLDKTCALKILPPELVRQDVSLLERFIREARSAAAVEHPNVLPVYFIGRAEENCFIEMQYVDGGNLQDLLDQRRKLDVRTAARVVRDVANALQAAHEKGIIHRDIKPSNVMLSKKGQVFVADFGLAKIGKAKTGLTQQGFVLGTPLYMSPEQAAGQAVGHRSDIYSLGAMFYEMLAGNPPYTADSPLVVLRMHESAPIPDVRQLAPDTPPPISAMIQKMMAKSPEQRYQNCAEVARELRTFLSVPSPPKTALPAPTMRSTSGLERKRRGYWAIAVGLLAFLLLLGAGAAYIAHERGMIQKLGLLERLGLTRPSPATTAQKPAPPTPALAVSPAPAAQPVVTPAPAPPPAPAAVPAPAAEPAAPSPSAPGPSPAPALAKTLSVPLGEGVKMDFVLIPAGTFMMGSEKDRSQERPVHQVTITKPFYMGIHEVTQAQWKALMGDNVISLYQRIHVSWGDPLRFKGDDMPMGTVSWEVWQKYLAKLQEKVGPGMTCRLPTEAEWEYACRAGSKTEYCFGNDQTSLGDYAWYNANSERKTHPVGQKRPNAWGLYDMHGNVSEWCQDWYLDSYYDVSPGVDPMGPDSGRERVIRGGWYQNHPDCARSAFRSGSLPLGDAPAFGCRIVMCPVPAPAEAPALPATGPAKIEAAPGLTKTLSVPLGEGVKMDLVLIPPGSYMMGSEKGMPQERPVHQVTITKPFYMGIHEVTQAQWKAVMGDNPALFKSDDLPVERVSWEDCQEFLAKVKENLSQGLTCRLPTEAEWEYACRAESKTKYCFGDNEEALSEYAWYDTNSDQKTHPVGQKKPNAWGLYDMHGNVWEWCEDWYLDSYYDNSPGVDPQGPDSGRRRVLRGGSWRHDFSAYSSSFRFNCTPKYREPSFGFRIVVSPIPGASEAPAAPATSAVAVAPKPETPSAVKEAVPQKPGRLPTGWTAETKRVKVATPEGEQEKDITYYTNTIGMKFVLVPSGEFIMGSPEGEDPVKARLTKSDEVPQHQVKITHPFYEGAHEVTQEQYERIMGKNPSYDTGVGSRNNPVDCVSWKDATEFCTRLSEKEGIKYRLPTEAEWEYACRAGSKTRYCFSNEDRFLSDYAWYRDNSRRTTHPVGQKSPNAWGIYDVHGNVCEWCQDGYDPEYYAKSPIKDPQGPPLADTPDAVARGGSWTSYAQTHRCACRWRAARSRGNEYIGFRVVCEAPGPSKATAPTTPASGAAPATPAAATKTQEPAPPPVAPAVPAESVASASQPKAPSASMPSGTPEKATAPPQPIEKTYDRAINFLGENIVREIVRNDLLVALVFDESKSLLEDRKVVMSKLEHLVADLRKELKPREAARLKWSVLSYSQKPTLWLAPTSNMEEVTETAKKIKVDESGVENVCATLSYTGKTLAPLGKKMCVVLITDEEGSDAHDEKAFRQAADDLQASKAKLIVFGRESQFQQGNAFAWLRDSNNQRVGPWYWSQRGIESCEQEFFATDWLFNRHRSGRVIGSGFGCWSLTTLAELTKGAFFITGEAPSTYDYKMDKFKPEWVLPEEYAKRTASSKLRTTIRKVIDEWTKFDPPPSLYKLDQLKAECEEAITKGEKALKFVEGAIDEMEGLRVRRSTERFARQRWQANYDLVLAELYKFRFMLRDYVAVLRDTRTNGFPKSKPGDKFNYYRILYDTNLKEPHTGPRGVKEWEQAKKAFDQVISDYAGTPWAEVAKFEKQATAPISISPSYDVQPTRPK